MPLLQRKSQVCVAGATAAACYLFRTVASAMHADRSCNRGNAQGTVNAAEPTAAPAGATVEEPATTPTLRHSVKPAAIPTVGPSTADPTTAAAPTTTGSTTAGPTMAHPATAAATLQQPGPNHIGRFGWADAAGEPT